MENKQDNSNQTTSHPEWEVQNSLTAPLDRTQEKLPLTKGVVLSENEVENAMDGLNVRCLKKFPRIEKFYADPLYNNQVYSLHSFVPAKGAKPNKDGVYGMVKFRGAFPNIEEANQRAEWLIRNADSYHNIYTGYIGRPFPLAISPKYAAETKEVVIKQQVVENISSDIKDRREKEKKEIEEIKEKEKRLLEDVSKPEDPYDKYTTLRVKKAQLIWTYNETMKKVNQMKDSIINCRNEIAEMDKENDDYQNQYMERYRKAREESGLKEDSDASFMKYMVEDLDLGF
jgi:hypothetical protein